MKAPLAPTIEATAVTENDPTTESDPECTDNHVHDGRSDSENREESKCEEQTGPELVFLLSDEQINNVSAKGGRRMGSLTKLMAQIGTIRLDSGLLKLRLSSINSIAPIQQLEGRLGLLFTREEIALVHDTIGLNEKVIINDMMRMMCGGVRFGVNGKGVRFVMIDIDQRRLFLTTRMRQLHSTDKNRSLDLSKIVGVVIGNSQHKKRSIDHCSCTVQTEDSVLVLSTPSRDQSAVRKFVAYLKCFKRHFRIHDERASKQRVATRRQLLRTAQQNLCESKRNVAAKQQTRRERGDREEESKVPEKAKSVDRRQLLRTAQQNLCDSKRNMATDSVDVKSTQSVESAIASVKAEKAIEVPSNILCPADDE